MQNEPIHVAQGPHQRYQTRVFQAEGMDPVTWHDMLAFLRGSFNLEPETSCHSS